VERPTATTRQGRLIAACFCGDLDGVRALLADDPSLARTRDEELESTPLHISAHRGHLQIVEALLAAGAEVDAREGCSGATALHWAAEGGHPAVAERLLDAGAALAPQDHWHLLSPHDWAVFVVHAPHLHRDRGAAAALLESRGAEPSIFAAIARGDAEQARRAVERDRASLEARLGPVDGGATPLVFAAERGAAAMVALLLELGADPNGAREGGLSALALARLGGDLVAEESLLAAGARRDLSFLLVGGARDEARALLRAEPELVRRGGRYEALLHALTLHGLAESAQLLLEEGADANSTQPCLGVDEWVAEVPPLFLAASKGRSSLARRLLDHGARVNEPAMRSRLTPLHVAAFRGWRPLVQLLLEAGADAEARDVRHRGTPADWARHAGREELAAEIETLAASRQPPQE
jgi:ankyrin repeat protein